MAREPYDGRVEGRVGIDETGRSDQSEMRETVRELSNNDPQRERFMHRFERDRYPTAGPANFRILAFLGRGEFGKVYLVEYLKSGEPRTFYALKSAAKAKFVTEAMQEQLLQEKKILHAVDHHFVMNADFAFGDQLNLYLALELAAHGSIKRYIRKMPERILKILITQLVCAIDYLHRCSIVHRDVKPANIMMGADGCIRLGDFGIATVNKLTSFPMCGELRYKAPEELMPFGYGDSVDWWPVGIIIFEIAFREHPFWREDDDYLSNVLWCCTSPIYYPERFEVTEPFRSVVEGFLQRHPASRLGVRNGGLDGIRSHQWFTTNFDFDQVARKGRRIPLTHAGVIDAGHEPDWILPMRDVEMDECDLEATVASVASC